MTIAFIPIEEIIIPADRQRTTFHEGAIIELADDIAEHGLIHPIALRAGDPPTLLAGERRFRAMTQLHRQSRTFLCAGKIVPAGTVPCIRVHEADELSYLEMELAENLQRVNLSWQEETAAKAAIHNLRVKQTGGAQTIAATAAELDPDLAPAYRQASLSDDLILSSHLDDPDIAKASSKSEAKKILQRKLEAERRKMLEEQFLASVKESPHTLIHGDAIEQMAMLKNESFDLLLTDPPYGVNAHEFGEQAFADHEYDDSPETWNRLMRQLAAQSFRICKPSSHAYVFCDIRNFFELRVIFEGHGWRVWERPFIWYKGNLGLLPRPKHGPRLTYEAILFASKGDRPVLRVAHDVISIPTSGKESHAAEKPVDLYRELMSRSVEPGATVIDPFAGSGTIFPAAHAASCIATGIELSETYHRIALERLEATND